MYDVFMFDARSNDDTRIPRTCASAERNNMARTKKTTTTTTAQKVCPFLRAIGADVFTFDATPEFFYRDKSTKDGLAVWSKQGERMYNRGYNARRALNAAIVARDEHKKGTKAYKDANAVVIDAQAKVDELAAQGIYKYGRVARTHGAAVAS